MLYSGESVPLATQIFRVFAIIKLLKRSLMMEIYSIMACAIVLW
jgi:hypothetical protein